MRGVGSGRRLGGDGEHGTVGNGLGALIDGVGTRGSGRMQSTVEKRERCRSHKASILLDDVDVDDDGTLYH